MTEQGQTSSNEDRPVVDLLAALQKSVTAAKLARAEDPPSEQGGALVHWVGEHNNTLHGNGAGSKDMEHVSGAEDEVTCRLCHNLLAQMARELATEQSSEPTAEGLTEFAVLANEIHRFRCTDGDCRHYADAGYFTPRDNDAASAVLAAGYVAADRLAAVQAEGLTEALHRAFHDHWNHPRKPLNLYADSPLWQVQAAAVERILADRLAAVQAERDDLMALAVEDTHRRGVAEAERDAALAALDRVKALADPVTFDHAACSCGLRVLDHDVAGEPCGESSAQALATWLRAAVEGGRS